MENCSSKDGLSPAPDPKGPISRNHKSVLWLCWLMRTVEGHTASAVWCILLLVGKTTCRFVFVVKLVKLTRKKICLWGKVTTPHIFSIHAGFCLVVQGLTALSVDMNCCSLPVQWDRVLFIGATLAAEGQRQLVCRVVWDSLSCGAYMMLSWNLGPQIVLRRNPPTINITTSLNH